MFQGEKPMNYITRKTLLYKTGVEYGDYTINHIQGCSHGCIFPCYAFMMAKRFGKVKSYEEWVKPKLVSNALSLLNKEIPKYKSKIKSVHLCFTSDPFMYGYPEISKMSMKIIEKLNHNNIKCTVLTKGILPQELCELNDHNEYGITLVSLDKDFKREYEPYSAEYKERIQTLKDLHNEGCKTWVSIEPYPTPNIVNQNLSDILNSISFVDKIIFGRLNYNRKVTQFYNYQEFYNQLSFQIIDFCKLNNKEYHIKDGTLKTLKQA